MADKAQDMNGKTYKYSDSLSHDRPMRERNGTVGLARWSMLVLIGLCCALLATACKKQATTGVAPTQGYQQLPEATNVLSALNEKNYDEAVAALVKLKESVSTEQQRSEYSLLSQQVRDKLIEASASDPKAQEALHAYGVMTRGR
jgi:hypothetical protein